MKTISSEKMETITGGYRWKCHLVALFVSPLVVGCIMGDIDDLFS